MVLIDGILKFQVHQLSEWFYIQYTNDLEHFQAGKPILATRQKYVGRIRDQNGAPFDQSYRNMFYY